MVCSIADGSHLKKLFAGVAEQTLQVKLGIADPDVTDYLVDLLLRFTHVDTIYRIRDTQGRRLEEVADMLVEAEARQANPQREVYRHIGDFTLFWTGLFPESLPSRSAGRKDQLLDYCEQGKRSYYIASTFDEEPFHEEAPVLRRLSDQFELFSVGLRRVRAEWEAEQN